ncbi:MAG: GGDEF domain-containing protein [Oscillospiraceae bacterium]|nr:GGDEF domain-containing protein [Oscillospiraceae bacterium]
MQKPKRFFLPLGIKITVFVVLMLALLSSVIIKFSYDEYTISASRHFREHGKSVVRTAAISIDGDSITNYLATGFKDDAYDSTLAKLRAMQTTADASGLYVFVPHADSRTFIYNTDENSPNQFGVTSVWPGVLHHLAPGMAKYDDNATALEVIAPTADGSLVFVLFYPVRDAAGTPVAYAGANFPMNNVNTDFHNYLVSIIKIAVAVALVVLLVAIIIVQVMIIKPVNKMAHIADKYVFLVPESLEDISPVHFSELKVTSHDELHSLANALKSMEQKNFEYVENLRAATRSAETDPLTGLYNRRAFEQRVNAILNSTYESGEVHAFAIIDFDYFKNVNDSYGHKMGDVALATLADTLRRSFRTSDIVARIGGDEFTIFCSAVGEKDIAERKFCDLLEVWRKTMFDYEDIKFSTTLSVGISLAPFDGKEYSELYEKADSALYRTKENGRNDYAFYGDISAET